MEPINHSRRSWARKQNIILEAAGFTLVELMVVVAVVGILATVAIPNYRKFHNRARQTEAKIALGAIYTAERSFAAEENSFTMCLRNAGFVPEGALRYYATGFNQPAGSNVCGPQGNRVCNGYAYGQVDPPPAATTTANDTTCVVGMGDVANPAIATAYGANARGLNSTIAVPTVTPDEDTAFPGGAGGCPVTQTTFTACAASALEGATYDRWTMSETGELTNITAGI